MVLPEVVLEVGKLGRLLSVAAGSWSASCTSQHTVTAHLFYIVLAHAIQSTTEIQAGL